MMETDRIYCMDCVEGIKQIPDSSIDLILTDPPYLIKETRAGGCSRLARTIQPVNNLIKENGLDLGISLEILPEFVRPLAAESPQYDLNPPAAHFWYRGLRPL